MIQGREGTTAGGNVLEYVREVKSTVQAGGGPHRGAQMFYALWQRWGSTCGYRYRSDGSFKLGVMEVLTNFSFSVK